MSEHATDGDKRAEHDRKVAAFLADMTEVCRRHGMTLDIAAAELAPSEAAEAIEDGDIELRPVPLDKHTSADPDAAWQHFSDGQVWWQS